MKPRDPNQRSRYTITTGTPRTLGQPRGYDTMGGLRKAALDVLKKQPHRGDDRIRVALHEAHVAIAALPDLIGGATQVFDAVIDPDTGMTLRIVLHRNY